MIINREAETASKAIEVLKFGWAERPETHLIISIINNDYLIFHLVKDKSIGTQISDNIFMNIKLDPSIKLTDIVERFVIESIRAWGGKHARFKT